MMPGLLLPAVGLFQAAQPGRFRDDSGGAPAVHDGDGGAGAQSTLSRGR